MKKLQGSETMVGTLEQWHQLAKHINEATEPNAELDLELTAILDPSNIALEYKAKSTTECKFCKHGHKWLISTLQGKNIKQALFTMWSGSLDAVMSLMDLYMLGASRTSSILPGRSCKVMLNSKHYATRNDGEEALAWLSAFALACISKLEQKEKKSK